MSIYRSKRGYYRVIIQSGSMIIMLDHTDRKTAINQALAVLALRVKQ